MNFIGKEVEIIEGANIGAGIFYGFGTASNGVTCGIIRIKDQLELVGFRSFKFVKTERRGQR